MEDVQQSPGVKLLSLGDLESGRGRMLSIVCWGGTWALTCLEGVGGAGATRWPQLRPSLHQGAAALRQPLGAHSGRARVPGEPRLRSRPPRAWGNWLWGPALIWDREWEGGAPKPGGKENPGVRFCGRMGLGGGQSRGHQILLLEAAGAPHILAGAGVHFGKIKPWDGLRFVSGDLEKLWIIDLIYCLFHHKAWSLWGDFGDKQFNLLPLLILHPGCVLGSHVWFWTLWCWQCPMILPTTPKTSRPAKLFLLKCLSFVLFCAID